MVDPSEEQMLYFNIRDSYLLNGAASTTVGVKKQAYFNEELIWEEDKLQFQTENQELIP
ncbi:MAG: hypothetical protein IPN54_11320 [Bacteroidetes bacterium]|nr:hypothetical protein [Bacteroidota bacterium]